MFLKTLNFLTGVALIGGAVYVGVKAVQYVRAHPEAEIGPPAWVFMLVGVGIGCAASFIKFLAHGN